MSDKILKEVKELNESLKNMKIGTIPSPLQVDDVFEDIKFLLTDKSIKAIKDNPVKQLMNLNKDGSVEYKVRYFGLTTNFKSVGAMQLAKLINEITDKYVVIGCLAGPSQLSLIPNSKLVINTISSFVFFALGADDAIKCEDDKYIIPIGETGQLYLETGEDIEEVVENGLDQLDKEKKND